jgi:predicted TIM-barrel fold metal-dependent hydrolase
MIGPDTVIALEEHYYDAELAALPGFLASAPMRAQLLDFESKGIEAMDRAGIDIQVISHNAPSGQALDAAQGDLMRRVNDRLAATCARHPGRLFAFAGLATADPEGAARELERCVNELGFRGAMIHGPTAGRFIDDPAFWPVFERAEALGVPVYLHPTYPCRAMTDLYCADYAARFPQFPNAAWGFAVETGSIAIRMVLSGVFGKHPGLRCILGHFGETLPFHLWRLNHTLSEPGPDGLDFAATFRRHFWLTSSGLFSNHALACSIAEMGTDRVMFSLDWPYECADEAVAWARAVPLGAEDRARFLGGNARELLRL